ncbi:hypothetical protein ACT17Q_00625 [Cellulomonas sp. CW35]|uniref:hypothetical protein n=1 Tax=unclassified Cellulomonas TaxID=2620175 RepID=UPI00258BA83C|nr:hypothetical protein [Cellulomonas sp.]MCR6706612.1 hypothetical protein [Cellulomonas sp.]
MPYYQLEPSVPGDLANETGVDYTVVPPRFTETPIYEFVMPPEADLVTALATYFVTPALADAIIAAQITGVSFADARVTVDDQVHVVYPGTDIGTWLWMKVDGIEGVHDAWRAGRLGYLTVNERFMDLLRRFRLHDAEITEVPDGA